MIKPRGVRRCHVYAMRGRQGPLGSSWMLLGEVTRWVLSADNKTVEAKRVMLTTALELVQGKPTNPCTTVGSPNLKLLTRCGAGQATHGQD